MDTSSLKTAYEALRDYLGAQNLYQNDATSGFDREHLASLFTAYYDAEAETLRAINYVDAGLENTASNDIIARILGYDSYSDLQLSTVNHQTIIKDGKIVSSLIDVDNIVAGQVAVADTDAGPGLVTIKPNEGLRMFDRDDDGYVQTATFTGRKIDSLEAVIPRSDGIKISEHVTSKLTLNVHPLPVTLASGTVTYDADMPLAVNIPQMSLICTANYSQVAGPSYVWPESTLPPQGQTHPIPSPVTIRASLLVNNVVKATLERVIDKYAINYLILDSPEWNPDDPFQPNPDLPVWRPPIQRPMVEESYWVLVHERMDMPAMEVLITPKNTRVEVKLTYSISCDDPSVFDNPQTWDIRVAARLGDKSMASPPVSEMLSISGAINNAAFFGNALLFSQGVDKFVGLASPAVDPAQLVVRSGKHGFRSDGKGQWCWSDKLKEWIPADRVLYRYYDPRGGVSSEARQWSYDGSKLETNYIKLGVTQFVLPEKSGKSPRFAKISDYFVRVTLQLRSWQGSPGIMVDAVTTNSFCIVTYSGDLNWQGYMLEVVYTGDWW